MQRYDLSCGSNSRNMFQMFYISSCVLYFQWFIKNREIWNHLMEKNFSNGKKERKKIQYNLFMKNIDPLPSGLSGSYEIDRE